jgi:SAM-dependent methyltransferase
MTSSPTDDHLPALTMSHVPAQPPEHLPGSKGREVGQAFLPVFIDLGGLRPDEAVLEPGCGSGRMAEALTGHLSADGSYHGFDVMAEAVRWCQEHITPRHPNFHFEHVDVYNGNYNPKGRLAADEFAFPHPDDSFDFVILTSVFTHMLPAGVRHYLEEIRRVLRPSGRCVATWFVLNDESQALMNQGLSMRDFVYEGDGYLYSIRKRPEAAIAYREEAVRELFEGAGLKLRDPIHYGRWSGRADGIRGQDITVATRPAERGQVASS